MSQRGTGYYRGFNDNEPYYQMTHLPWCVPPINNLPECQNLKNMYPPRSFPLPPAPGIKTPTFPLSLLPEKLSIYQTGESYNPNSYTGLDL